MLVFFWKKLPLKRKILIILANHASRPVLQTITGKGASKVICRPIIEDYQLPTRYRRQALDQQEIDAINVSKLAALELPLYVLHRTIYVWPCYFQVH